MLLLYTFVLFQALIAAEKKSYDGYQIWQVHPKTQEDLQFLLKLEENGDINFWSRSKKIRSPSEILVKPELVNFLNQKLTQMKMKIDVRNSNLQTQIDEENEKPSGPIFRSASDFNYDLGQYHSFLEIMGFAENLAKNSNFVKKLEIGRSVEGRPLIVLKISSDSKTDSKTGSDSNVNKKKAIWLDFGIHAREWISPAVGQFILNELATSNQAEVIKLREKFDFYIMPLVNPDGYEYTFLYDRFWRKNRRPNTIGKGWSGSCHGVDLNRNFDSNFGGISTSTNGCNDVYRGAFAFSEPETKAISQFILANKDNIIAFFTFHSFSQVWGYSWGHAEGICPPDVADIAEVAETGVNAIRAVEGTEYQVGSIADIMYGVGGASDDWAKTVAGIKYTFTLELRPCANCVGGFVLAQSKIIPTAKETWAGVMAAANKIDEHLRTGGNGLLKNGDTFRTGCRVSDFGFKYSQNAPSGASLKSGAVIHGNNANEQICEDTNPTQCKTFKTFNTCSRFSALAKINCRKTCGYC